LLLAKKEQLGAALQQLLIHLQRRHLVLRRHKWEG